MARQLDSKWASVEMMSDAKVLGALTDGLRQDQLEFKSNTYATQKAGQVTVYRDAKHPGVLLEIVYGTTNDDFIQTLYRENPIFADRTVILKARQDLIEMIEDIMEADEGRLMMECPARRRPVELRELPTMALIHTLKALVHQRG